ncbi:MAG: CoA transferase [Alphaproteobacteria bacterium]|nr:CoA transferase [Alphaproteobacteria bacterium]MBV9816134.1 CoA transferase [Alphaproteobacteria bacterium]
MKVIGHEDLIADPRFATREASAQHEVEIDRMISEWTQRHDKHEAMRLIGGAGVPAGAVLDTGDLLDEPSFEKRGMIQRCDTQKGSSACRPFRCVLTAPRRRSNRHRCSVSTPPRCSAIGST